MISQEDDASRSALSPIQQFRKSGLDAPIVLKADHRLAVGGGALWLLACVSTIAIAEEILLKSIGVLGIASAILIAPDFLPVLFRRGSLIFSQEGIYHGYCDLLFEWRDVGPAWISTRTVRGTQVRITVFLVRRASFYKTQAHWFKRRLISGHSTNKRFFSAVVSNPSNLLEEMRNNIAADPDAVVLTIPKVIRDGLSDEDTIEIINSVVLQRADD